LVVFVLILIVIATGIALWGALSLTQATQGVGLIAIACFLGILPDSFTPRAIA
jgi:hypothetical protein